MAVMLSLAGPAAARECGTVIVPTGVGINDVPGAVATMHPALFTGSAYEAQLMTLLYRPLVWLGKQMKIDWSQGLASSIDVNADRTVFTVTLRPFAWSDGRPVTSDDVLYDWSLIRTLRQAYSQYGNGGVPTLIRDIRALDPHRLEFDLTRPVNPEWFEIGGLSQFFALPRQAWGRYDIGQQQTRQSETSFYDVVDGPMRLQDFVLGRYAVFTPNPAYSGPRVSIRRLVVNFLQGTDPLEALQSGQLDMASLPFDLWSAAKDLKDVRWIGNEPAQAFGVIVPNLRNRAVGFFDAVPVRQAIKQAIDQQRIIATVFHGNASLQAGLIPAALGDLMAPDLRNGKTSLPYDPAHARALLDQAGWVPGPDGIRIKDGHRLAFTVLVTADAAARLLLLQIIQADLAKIGVALSIREVEFNQLIARMLGPPAEWEAVFLNYTVESYPDPVQYFEPGASGNYEHYSDPTMTRLLDAANSQPGRDGLYAVEDYIVSQQPLIFLPDGSYSVLARPGIEGVRQFINPTGSWSPEYLKLSGSMACDAPHA